MDALLNQLIITAQRLLEISHQVIEKEELNSLQKTQDQQVRELMALDDAFHKSTKKYSKGPFPLRERIDEKLEQFEKLNAQFIKNIHESRALLNFDKLKETQKHKESP